MRFGDLVVVEQPEANVTLVAAQLERQIAAVAELAFGAPNRAAA
jgi:hypothetical protein